VLQTLNPAALKTVTQMSGHVSSMLSYYSTDVLNNSDTNANHAYLNYLTLDNMFDYVAGQSGAMQVGPPGAPGGQLRAPLSTSIPITTSGYLCIFVANADPYNVYFDNLSVQHFSGQLTEENHYYPFGLAMVPLSDRALKAGYGENKYRFNSGSEIQNKEFSDGRGLEWYETPLRTMDPQLGRWWQIDSKPDESQSPYSMVSNNPIRYNDPGGDQVCCKELWNVIKETVNGYYQGKYEAGAFIANHVVTGPGTDALLQSGGGAMNGMVNSASFGTWNTNPAQYYFGVNTSVDQTAIGMGQAAGLPYPGAGGPELPNAGPAVAAVGDALVIGKNSLVSALKPVATLYAGKATADMAKQGADLAGITQNTKKIPAPSGKAQYRVPDELTTKAIGDVKLVDKLHFSSQIKDFLAYAQQYQIPFTLYLRGGANPTKLTPQLQEQVDNGLILLQRLIPNIIR
jgi:RHS repeat-associated protein